MHLVAPILDQYKIKPLSRTILKAGIQIAIPKERSNLHLEKWNMQAKNDHLKAENIEMLTPYRIAKKISSHGQTSFPSLLPLGNRCAKQSYSV